MPTFNKLQNKWAVLLAGGDGMRLKDLTLRIAGDRRPKQFCSLFGAGSLLRETRSRLESCFDPDRQLCVVTASHEPFYSSELNDMDPSRVIVQPWNRGTGIAVALAVICVLRQEPEAVVAFFPCDHHYASDQAFVRATAAAIKAAEANPDSIVLLGAQPQYPEPEYGWIEPGPSVMSSSDFRLMKVRRFVEKPSLAEARLLYRSGYLWNTFVSAGYASAYLELICATCPEVVLAVTQALDSNDLEAAYRRAQMVDFSRDVLACQPHRLLVLRDSLSGWTDLGNSTRLIDTLVRHGIEPEWLKRERMHGAGALAALRSTAS